MQTDFDDLEDLTANDDSGTTAALLHGFAMGMASSGAVQIDDCADRALAGMDDTTFTAILSLLQTLFAEAQNQLAARQSELSMYLPADDTPLSERIDALADLCQGFVLGLLANGAHKLETLPGDAAEIVRDIMAISSGEADPADPEMDERALAELEEYVRVGVQVVYEEIDSPESLGNPMH
jgi:hypothetical protein